MFFTRIRETWEALNQEFENLYKPSISVNLIDYHSFVRLVANVAGFNKEDLKISLNKNKITISSNSKEAEDSSAIIHELFAYPFERIIELPDCLYDYDNIETSLVGGLLTITIKKLNTKPKQEVNIEL